MLVMGGAQGIGVGIVYWLAVGGAKVGVFDFNVDAARVVVEEIRLVGGSVVGLGVDVFKCDQV